MDDDKKKKKANTFFCCSAGKAKEKRKDLDFQRRNTKEDIVNSKNSINQEKGNSSSKVSSNDVNNIEKNHNHSRVKDSSLNDVNISMKSATPRIEKHTMPNTAKEEKASIERSRSISLNQNLKEKLEIAAKDKENESNIYNPTNTEPVSIPAEERPMIIKDNFRKTIDISQYSSLPNSNSKANNININNSVSIKDGVDFTFKRSVLDNKSEVGILSARKNGSNQNINTNLNEAFNSVEHKPRKIMIPPFKESSGIGVGIIPPKEITLDDKRIRSNDEKVEKNENFPRYSGSNNNITSKNNLNILVIPPLDLKNTTNNIIHNNNNKDTEEAEVEDEFKEAELVDQSHSNSNSSDFNQSVISSNVRSHIRTPKMISNIKTDQSFFSHYTKSENSRLDTNNILITENNHNDTEFEITNEHSEGFHKFIETPKSSTLFPVNKSTSNNTQYTTSNPHLKEIYDKLAKKEREIKKINDKIHTMVSDLHKIEEENKRFERRIEKEEAEGEKLRHFLNFLTTSY